MSFYLPPDALARQQMLWAMHESSMGLSSRESHMSSIGTPLQQERDFAAPHPKPSSPIRTNAPLGSDLPSPH